MKHDFSDSVTDLPIEPATAAVLRENNVHTMQDLACAFYDRRLKPLLSEQQHIEVIKAAWVWIMRPFEKHA